MRMVWKRALTLVPALGAAVYAGGPPATTKLGIGDAAPPLRATEWLKGTPVPLPGSGGPSAVVIEFWATWCAPCRESIPELSALQERYGADRVRVVGVTRRDENNTLPMVRAFLEKWGERIGYTIAFDESGELYDSYMQASGQYGIPTAFVVDAGGKIAWIGHPLADSVGLRLEEVLEATLAGRYDLKVARQVAEVEAESERAWAIADWGALLRAADRWEALRPSDPTPYQLRFYVHGLSGDAASQDAAKATAAVEKAIALSRDSAVRLAGIASELARDSNPKYLQIALGAVNRALELDAKEPTALIAHYRILAALGKRDEAIRAAESAVHRLKGHATHLSRFAIELTHPATDQRCTELAVQAVDLAIAADPGNTEHLNAKFDILVKCRQDLPAAAKLGSYFVERCDDAMQLNNFAWMLLTEPEKQEKFNELALTAAEKSHRLSGGKSWMFLDTYALARFANGELAEAIELQRKALELCDNGMALGELRGRLRRFEDSSPVK